MRRRNFPGFLSFPPHHLFLASSSSFQSSKNPFTRPPVNPRPSRARERRGKGSPAGRSEKEKKLTQGDPKCEFTVVEDFIHLENSLLRLNPVLLHSSSNTSRRVTRKELLLFLRSEAVAYQTSSLFQLRGFGIWEKKKKAAFSLLSFSIRPGKQKKMKPERFKFSNKLSLSLLLPGLTKFPGNQGNNWASSPPPPSMRPFDRPKKERGLKLSRPNVPPGRKERENPFFSPVGRGGALTAKKKFQRERFAVLLQLEMGELGKFYDILT